MDQQCIFLFLAMSIIVSAMSSEEDKFSVTSPTIKVNEDRLSSTVIPIKEDDSNDNVKGDLNKHRTIPRTLGTNIKDNCCGPKQGSSIRSTEPIVRHGDYDGRLSHSDRIYSPRYGNRPEERYGWQSSNYPSGLNAGRPTSGQNGVYGQNNPDRYSQRPQYGNDNHYSGTNRPGNTYGSNYGDGRPHGNAIYGGKPGYGVSGTFGDGGEFNGPIDHGYQEVERPQGAQGVNIQTQKAVALKALAGVALIGAAAALATNPVLLPIGVISGRRKRSDSTNVRNDDGSYPSKVFSDFLSKIRQEKVGHEFAMTPYCVARLACEVQKDYIADLRKNEEILNKDKNILHSLELWFINLIRRNVLDVDYVSTGLKKLIKLAVTVGSDGQDCRIFSCDIIKN